MSQLQGFGFPKLLTRKRRLFSILFRNLRFTRTNGRCRFFENQWTFGYCIQISKDLDTISKSLKIFIQFFIGYPNTCTWCGIQAVICSWLYELLMSLRRDIWNVSYIELRIWNQVSYDHNCDDRSSLDFKSAVQYMKHFIYHFTSILHGLIRTT